MKKLILLTISGVMLLASCSAPTVSLPNGTEIVLSDNIEPVRAEVAQKQGQLVFPAKSMELDISDDSWVPQPMIVSVSIGPGMVFDTFTQDDPYGYYSKNDPSGVVIINNTDSEGTFDLSILLETKGYCELTGVTGIVAPPEYVREWIVLSKQQVTVRPKEAKLVPVALIIPKNAEIFAPIWEFSVQILRESGTNVMWGWRQRWIIFMQE